MDDAKDKVKGLMKKINNPFSSSASGKFKGQGRVLGSSSESGKFKGQGRVLGSSSVPSTSSTTASTPVASSSHPLPSCVSPAATEHRPRSIPQPSPQSPHSNVYDFSAFDAFISNSRRASAMTGGYECPVCAARSFGSEEEVAAHVETCLAENEHSGGGGGGGVDVVRDGVSLGVATFLSGEPPETAVEVVLKLLRNVAREPANVKFRRVRMSNPKIKEAVGDVKGGVALLERVGFGIREEEDGEVWGVMDEPGEEQISLIKEAVSILERRKEEDHKEEKRGVGAQDVVQQRKIDRQVRVFFLIPGSVPERIELPNSFYILSAEEIKREVELRKQKLAESQLLIPKSYKEKQMKAARRKYKATLIRIQLPDGVLLQATFLPWERTTALYQFVSCCLKDPSLEFELIQPLPHKRRVIPQLPSPGGKPPTLEDEDLIPSALVKFKPIETDSHIFTGLTDELLVTSEPLIPAS